MQVNTACGSVPTFQGRFRTFHKTIKTMIGNWGSQSGWNWLCPQALDFLTNWAARLASASGWASVATEASSSAAALGGSAWFCVCREAGVASHHRQQSGKRPEGQTRACYMCVCTYTIFGYIHSSYRFGNAHHIHYDSYYECSSSDSRLEGRNIHHRCVCLYKSLA